MNFNTMENECFAQLSLDSTATANQTLVTRWLNISQQDLAGRWPWNWLRSREAIVTIIDYTTGTVSVTDGATTVTGSGTTFTAGMIGRFIQLQGANDWYEITAVGGATSLTIALAYQPSSAGTNLTAGTFIIRKFFYSLSSSTDRIIDIKNWNTPLKLVEVDPRTIDDRRPNPQSTATSSAFIAYGYDSSGNLQISPYPFPNDGRLLEFRTIKRAVDLVHGDTTTTIVIPAKWHHVMIFGALALGFAYLRKFDASTFWNAEYEKKINDMLKQQRTSEDDQPVLKAIDSVARGNFVRLPDSYPAVGPGGA